MAQVINTNIASLNAQRNLGSTQSMLQTSLQRLSSGLRINSAADDAAGLAISSRMTTQINGLNQAARNSNDGISLAQTGDGALAEVTNNLQRIRELAVQATNSTNSASDRATLNQEVQQRLAEIDRMASQTSFNGQRILDGSFGSAAFQVGANAGETISLSLGAAASVRTDDMGKIASTTSASTFAGIASKAFAETSQALAVGNYSLTNHAAVDAATTMTLTGTNFTSAAVNANTTIALNNTNFYTAAVDQGLKIAPLSTVFGSATNATSGFTFVATDFSAVGSGLGHSGINLADTMTGGVNGAALGANFNFAGTNGTFSVDGHAVTLTTNYSALTSYATVASDIQTQLNTVAGTGTYTVGITDLNGQMTITNNFSTNAVAITGANGAATTAGIANDGGVAGGKGYVTSSTAMSGYDFSGANLAQFNVTTATQTIAVALTTNVTNAAGLVSAVQTQLDAVTGAHTATNGYTVSMDHGSLMIQNNAGAAAVNIANADANANAKGITSTVGTAGVATTHTSFTIGGHIINLSTNEASAASIATNLQTQLRVYDPNYAVTVPSGSTVQIVKNGSSLASDVAIAGATGIANTAGINNAAGTAGVATASASFTLDGVNVTLSGVSGMSSLVTALSAAMGASYTVTNNNDGSLTVKKNGINSGNGLAITNADAQATSSGFANFASGAAATSTATAIAGAAAQSSTFTIDGHTVTLSANYSGGTAYSDLASALTSQMTAPNGLAGYTVAATANGIKITNTGSTGTGPAMANATGQAAAAGVISGATQNTGSAAVSSSGFTVGGQQVTIDATYAGSVTDAAALASYLNGTGTGLLGGTGFVASGSGTALTIKKTGDYTDNGLTVAAMSGNANTAGLNNSGTKQQGSAATASSAVSFTIDGHAVTLTADYSGKTISNIITDVTSQLGANAADYTITSDAGKLKFERTSASNLAAPTVTNSSLAFTGVAGTANGSITVNNDLTINGVAITNGTYTGDQLAARINGQVAGVYATFGSNALSLVSAANITLAGAQVANTGLSAGTVAAGSSKLSSVDVSTTAGANTALMQIDSALTSVNALRGTFGAIQNRFTSAIASLQAASENVTSARSRIQDTDFAAETASMTRSQILQQAGVAMLAQANALPNSVLALLK